MLGSLKTIIVLSDFALSFVNFLLIALFSYKFIHVKFQFFLHF